MTPMMGIKLSFLKNITELSTRLWFPFHPFISQIISSRESYFGRLSFSNFSKRAPSRFQPTKARRCVFAEVVRAS